MAGNNNINISNLVVDNHEPKEVVDFVYKSLSESLTFLDKCLKEQNLYAASTVAPNIAMAVTILRRLSEKMNGQKGPTVL